MVDNISTNALMIASYEGYKNIVELMILKGVELNTVSIFGQTALMDAATNGQSRIVKILLDAGADYTLINDENLTAYEISYSQEHYNQETYLIFKIFIEKGCFLLIKSKFSNKTYKIQQ